MRLAAELRERLGALFHGARGESEMEAELRFHIEMQTEENLRRGMEPEEARRQAALAFGGVERVKEEVREARGLGVAENFVRDLRYALRALRRTPGFTVTAALTLALGVGANTAIFSIVDAVLLAPLPYPDGNRIATIFEAVPESSMLVSPTMDAVGAWRDEARSIEGAETVAGAEFSVTGSADPEIVPGARISAGFTSLLGVRAAVGRTFSPADGGVGAAPVVLIGTGYWKSRFGGAPDVVGRTLAVDEIPRTIVGIVPSGFDRPLSPGPGREIWIPARAQDVPGMTVVRIRPGATDEAVGRELERIARRVGDADQRITVLRPQELAARGTGPMLLAMAGVVMLVLLIACINLANLLLIRGAARDREIAVRQALGASRGRIVGQLLTEGVLLAGLAAILGISIAALGLRVVLAVRPANLEILGQVRLGGRALAYALGLTVIAALVCSLFPAMRAAVPRHGNILTSGAATSALGASSSRFRAVLVVAEIAASFVVLISAGLLVRTMVRIENRDPGYLPAGMAIARIRLPPARYTTPTAREEFFRSLQDAARRLPGVESVTLVSDVPPDFGPVFGHLAIAGRSTPPDAQEVVGATYVQPGALRVMGVRLHAGHGMSPVAGDRPPREVVVNSSTAQRLWPGTSPLGQKIRLADGPDPEWYTVVGVASDIATNVSGSEFQRTQLYFPLTPGARSAALVLRVRGEPLDVIPPLAAQLRSLDSRLPLREISTGDSLLDLTLTRHRFAMRLLLVFAMLAVTLAGIGLYGVIGYTVRQRTREIGVRLAIGASAAQVQRALLLEGATLAGVGLALGLIIAAAVSRALATLLFGVTPHDPATFAGAAALLGVVTLVASLVPARRATRIDPMIVLRTD